MKVGNGTDIPVKSIEIIQTKASVTGAEAESKNAQIGTNLVKISAGLILAASLARCETPRKPSQLPM